MALSDFSRHHYRRLAWYFAHGKSGGNAGADAFDLDLVGEGLIARKEEWAGHVRFTITPAGEHLLYLRKEEERARRRPHHELGHRLTPWLEAQDRLCWENIEFRVELPDGAAVVRPDVLSMVKTLNPDRMVPIVYEVKVSRADFLADVKNPSKRAAYFQLADYVVYVLPEGMVTPDEVPPECGLVVENAPGVFKVVRKGRKNKNRPAFPSGHWMALVLRQHNQLQHFDAERALAQRPGPAPVSQDGALPPASVLAPLVPPTPRVAPVRATPRRARPAHGDVDTLDL